MKIFVALLVFAIPAMAFAQSNPFETTNDARARHSADRYNQYRTNNYQAPLGGYNDRLGDPAPLGTISPGYNSPHGRKPSLEQGGSESNSSSTGNPLSPRW